MRSTLAALLLIGLPAVAFAQATPQVAAPTQPPAAAPAPTVPLRNITVRNRSGLDVVEAHATVLNKGDVLVTAKGKIETNEIRSFQLPRDQCVETLAARLSNGKAVATSHLDDCKLQQFTVFPDHIAAD